MLKEAINYILKLWRIFVLRRQFNELRAVGFYERLYQPHFRINGLLCISNVFLCITRMEYLHSIIIIYHSGVLRTTLKRGNERILGRSQGGSVGSADPPKEAKK
jgi:hypothetical protein